MDSGMVAIGFVQHYYHTFDLNRPGSGWFYRDESSLNFEGQTAKGAHNILNHHVNTIDCQLYGLAGGFLVFVTSIVWLAGEQHALKFNEVYL
ncbi:hypothetical protein UlMin_008861 [Ulmus minor]